MAMPTSYMITVKNVPSIFSAIQEAQVPPRFTKEFLRTLGFKSSNDRSVIGVMKALNFLDQSGVPTETYRRYRNKGEAPYVLADAIREAYSDVFLASEHAETLSGERVKNIIATKVDKGDSVIEKMASTFRALVSIAKWDQPPQVEGAPSTISEPELETQAVERAPVIHAPRPSLAELPFRYNIEIHLPVTKDITVYNAIFRSLREHLQ
jgi:Family of unknown function (DUF5343)